MRENLHENLHELTIDRAQAELEAELATISADDGGGGFEPVPGAEPQARPSKRVVGLGLGLGLGRLPLLNAAESAIVGYGESVYDLGAAGRPKAGAKGGAGIQ